MIYLKAVPEDHDPIAELLSELGRLQNENKRLKFRVLRLERSRAMWKEKACVTPAAARAKHALYKRERYRELKQAA